MERAAHYTVDLDDLNASEADFRREHPWVWGGTLVGPLVVSGLLLLGLFFYAGWEFASRLVANTALALWLVGRFIILSGAEGGVNDFEGALSSFQLFLLMCYLDVMTALILAFHVGFLFRLPYIGPRVAALVTDSHFILDAQPWMRRATFFGLIAFVGFPLSATGSVGGSIFGRLLGLSRPATFICICIGSLIGNGFMYWFADIIDPWIDNSSSLFRFGGVAVIVLIVIVLERRYRTLRDRFANENVKDLPEKPKQDRELPC